jgi:DNA-binding NarL/FixJ family response regulator
MMKVNEATLQRMEERILLVDHRKTMRDALGLYLGRFADEWRVVSKLESAEIEELVQHIDEFRPDITILFAQTAGESLQTILHDLAMRYPETTVLVSGVHPDEVADVTAWGAGALHLTTETPQTLLTRLRVLRFDRDE